MIQYENSSQASKLMGILAGLVGSLVWLGSTLTIFAAQYLVA